LALLPFFPWWDNAALVAWGGAFFSRARAPRSARFFMLARVLTLKFDPVLGRIDDASLQAFIKDRDVLSIREHFFTREEIPYLAIIVTYNPKPVDADTPATTEKRQPTSEEDRKEKWRGLLVEDDWPLFNTLRDWRNGQAREEGIPPYVICSNVQLAHIAHNRPESPTQLATIEGMGKAKIERYGAALIKNIADQPNESEPHGTEQP
jgi:superfamily II DNA helicase RecQ